MPLVEKDALVAVITLYSEQRQAYNDDHVRLLELLAPHLTTSLLDCAIAEEEAAGPTAAAPSLRLVKRG
jgi:hypothetical protein